MSFPAGMDSTSRWQTLTHLSGTVTLTNIVANDNNNNEVAVDALKQITIKIWMYNEHALWTTELALTSPPMEGSVLDPGGTDWNYLFE